MCLVGNRSAYVIAQIPNSLSGNQSIVYFKIYQQTFIDTDESILLGVTRFMSRDRQLCAMQYVSVNSIEMPIDNAFIGVIEGVDDDGHTFRRTKTYLMIPIGMYFIDR